MNFVIWYLLAGLAYIGALDKEKDYVWTRWVLVTTLIKWPLFVIEGVVTCINVFSSKKDPSDVG
jgi:hypothetical protein